MSGASKLYPLHAATVARLYADGLKLKEIGDQIGVSHEAIRRWLEKQGIDRRAASDYGADDQTRFWTHIVRRGDDECWGWRGTTRDGYGRTHFKGRLENANRIAWILANGPIPRGIFVLHTCDNRPCCNPNHLFLGTNVDNMRDMAIKGRAPSKLTIDQVKEIKRLLERGVRHKDIGAEFGVGRACIQAIFSGRNWSHVTA